VTWAFGYLLVLLIGLVMVAASGTLRTLPHLTPQRHLVAPHPEQRSSAIGRLGWRLGIALLFAGGVGLAFEEFTPFTAVIDIGAGAAAGLGVALAATVLGRRHCPPALAGELAVVVREIGPGAFGQVRLSEAAGSTVLAARSVDLDVIPAGAQVEVVDCSRSVLLVRRAQLAA
jgi:hypothetical protein